MDKYIKQNLQETILAGKFFDAKALITHFSQKEFSDTIYEIADETHTIIVYTFICSLLKEFPQYHFIAAEILLCSLILTSFSSPDIPGIYNSALYHARKALELDPNNINYMESLLFFYSLPNQLISKTETLKIAQKILNLNPNHQYALKILSKK